MARTGTLSCTAYLRDGEFSYLFTSFYSQKFERSRKVQAGLKSVWSKGGSGVARTRYLIQRIRA
jgi:hypothetical protein